MKKPKTLLLDNCFSPILVIDWRKAMCLIFLGKVEIVANHEEEVSTAHRRIKIPSILRILHPFKKPRKSIKFTRSNIFVRDRNMCQYCGSKEKGLTIDHVVPTSRGGTNEWTNVVVACRKCQTLKGPWTPEEVGMVLLNKPKQPIWARAAEIRAKTETVYPGWGEYLFI